MALRALTDSILSQTANDMRRQCETVNAAFRKRVQEVKDAKHKLETLLAMVSGKRQSVESWKQWAWVTYQFSQSNGLSYFALRILPSQYWQHLHSPSKKKTQTPCLRFYFLSSVCATREVNPWTHSLHVSVAVDIGKDRTPPVSFSYVGPLQRFHDCDIRA